MNKPAIVLLGIAAGLISVFFLDELLKMSASAFLLKEHASLVFSGLKLKVVLKSAGTENFIAFTAVMLTPYLGSMLFIETSLLLLKKATTEIYTAFHLIFQLVNIGYLIISILINIASVFIKLPFETDWQQLPFDPNLSYNKELTILLLFTFILLIYINVLTKRIKKNIPAISRK